MDANVYTLKWKLFHEGITASLRELRKDEVFNDVTLTFDDEKYLEVNKTILAACSPVFRNMIKRLYKKQPYSNLVYLSGMSSKLVSLLVDFMYKGEIKILAAEVELFLKVANQLKVKGLAIEESIEAATNAEKDVDDVTAVDSQQKDNLENYANSNLPMNAVKDEFSEPNNEKPAEYLENREMIVDNNKLSNESNKFNAKSPMEVTSSDVADPEDVSLYFDGKAYKCKDCDKTFPRPNTLRNHRELLHDIGRTWTCPVAECLKTFRIKATMNGHVWRIHGGNRKVKEDNFDTIIVKKEAKAGEFNCNKCTKSFTTERSLVGHIDYYHAKEGVVFDCGICPKTFSTKNAKNAHSYNNHTKEERDALKAAKQNMNSFANFDSVPQEMDFSANDYDISDDNIDLSASGISNEEISDNEMGFAASITLE